MTLHCVNLNRGGKLSYTFKPGCTEINPQANVPLHIKKEREIKIILLEYKMV